MEATKPQYSLGKQCDQGGRKKRGKIGVKLPKVCVESVPVRVSFVFGQNQEKLVGGIFVRDDEAATIGKLKRGVRIDPHADSFGDVIRKILHAGGIRSHSEHI